LREEFIERLAKEIFNIRDISENIKSKQAQEFEDPKMFVIEQIKRLKFDIPLYYTTL